MQGDTTNTTGRIYPRRVIPWGILCIGTSKGLGGTFFHSFLFSDSVFPSQHQLEYVKSLLHPVSNEIGLQNCQRDVMGNAVQKLVKGAYENLSVRRLRTAFQ
ncbi:hypothetical protein EDB81DRAFT_892381 [Dactylonectria macrodidyma]|uniref:Uncharacterized protein n=1 Tax=Dactylonectria macrodidyma TaxID=307937 RepID=A0A9P9DE74_9HYPO|nr:hypothetical protein EDB81DRAFT_892381 [Dactylonectria macrodidyma]